MAASALWCVCHNFALIYSFAKGKTTKAQRHQEQQLIFAARAEPMFIVEDTPKELCRNYYERAEWRGTLCAFVPWWFAVAVGMPVVQ